MKRAALIVGGGPAGLSAGIALARAGFETEIHEQRPTWKGRVCGSFINPDGVRALDWMGLLAEARRRGAVPVLETSVFTANGRRTMASTVQDGTPSLAFARRKLEELLAEEFERCGGRLVPGSRVVQTDRRGDDWQITARAGEFLTNIHVGLLVRAGGRFGEAAAPAGGGWQGWNALFWDVPQAPGEMSMHFGRHGYVGVLTFADGTTNVCGLTRRSGAAPASWDAVFREFQDENERFSQLTRHARRLDDWHGVGALPFTARPRTGRGALLAGDAAAVGDPFMGEGIGRALATAPLMAEALRAAGATTDSATSSATETGPDAIAAHYGALWRRAYASRLTLGSAARWLLERPWVMSRLAGGFLRPSVIARATPLFHRGAGFDRGPQPETRPDLVKTDEKP
jgi:2-polyprenyl-6-methoxyphenol hydroxylase-like FAD-dependent oxidoreductase